MAAVTTDQVQDLLESMYPVRNSVIPCLIGKPGIGKTEGVRRFADKKGVKVVEFILSNTIPSEVSGMRMPDKDSKSMEVFDDLRMASLRDGDILFFDEILEAPDILKSACLTLLQSRLMASGRPLPDVMVVAASNPVGNPANLSESFRDRFVFFEVEPTYKDWATWMLKTRHVRVSRALWDNTESRLQDGYNILSPRKLTALIDWYLADKEHAAPFIDKAYGGIVSSMIEDVCAGELSDQDKAVDLLDELGLLGDIEDEWVLRGMTPKDFLDALMVLPEWPEIEKALAEAPGKEVVQDEDAQAGNHQAA
jgi:hypothetical protein